MAAEAVLDAATVRLRPLAERDLPLLLRWSNDPEVRHWLHRSERPPSTLELERELHEQRLRDPLSVDWCIETSDGGPIGVLRLRGIDEAHTRAELGVYIGEKDRWGRGHGTDAIRRVLRFAFEELGLRRVWLITDADNARGIRCYQKCGFAQEGVLRGHRLRYGRPLDMLAMGVLREEWEAQPSR
jgi:RimJ/RimL family protein N-acetyltransferase